MKYMSTGFGVDSSSRFRFKAPSYRCRHWHWITTSNCDFLPVYLYGR